jgi:glycosyltransferase involved in cell wall biosynthesis
VKGKTLLIFTTFPSSEHPYISTLFSEVFRENKKVDILCFHRTMGNHIFSKKPDQSLSFYEHRFFMRKNWLNIFGWFGIFKLLIWRRAKTRLVYRDLSENGVSLKEKIKVIFNFQDILSEEYATIYCVALQLLPHFRSKFFFGNAKIIVSSRGQDFDLYPEKYSRIIDWVDILHVLGGYIYAKALDFGFNKRVLKIINPSGGYDIPSEEGRNLLGRKKDGPIVFGTAARLYWTKGHIYILRSLNELKRRGIQFSYLIIGKGPEENYLKMEVIRLGMEKEIFFLGWLSGSALLDALKKLDIYVLLSIEEGYNNSVVIAQKLGLPCVVSHSGGLPENVVHEETGFVVNPYEQSEIVNSFFKLATDQALRNEYSNNARDLASTRNSFSRQVEEYKMLILE